MIMEEGTEPPCHSPAGVGGGAVTEAVRATPGALINECSGLQMIPRVTFY